MGQDLSAAEFSRKLVEVFPQVMRGIMRRQSDALTKGKITAPQFLVLDLIYSRGSQKMSGLAKELQVSLPAMTGLIERLCKMRLVTRLSRQKDRRVIMIDITSRGREVVRSFRSQRERIVAEIFGQLSEKERRDYLRIIIKIKDILHAKVK